MSLSAQADSIITQQGALSLTVLALKTSAEKETLLAHPPRRADGPQPLNRRKNWSQPSPVSVEKS
jgi:hypothetical protein